ncbi:MAG: gamma carbonic anhydrase family protein [Candidatus Sericytochromatia bacterium]
MYIQDDLNIHKSVFIAPNTDVVGKVSIGENSSIWFQSVLRGDVDEIVIGQNCNIQDSCVIHCVEGFPTKMGNNVSLGHGVILHGCTLGNNVLVGMRATILTGAIIGNNCLIAAGALVSENMVIPDNSLVIGIPAKVKKEINESQLKLINKTAENYIEYSRMYIKKYEK